MLKEGINNDSFKKQTISSGGWNFLEKGFGLIIHFIIGIILARLLPPSDFGLLGLGMIVIVFGEIFVNLGLGPSLIQRQKITERHIQVVFGISIISGFILSILVFTGAPLTAQILDDDNVVEVVRSLSVIFLISGFHIPSRALLKKKMDFQSLFYIGLFKSFFYGGVTITFALLDYGVWSLVIGTLISRIVDFIGSYLVVRHSLKPLFAKKEFLELFNFGFGETLGGISSYFALQGDYIMIGRILGVHELGLYTRAYSLMQMPTRQLISVFTDVLFPAASRIQSDKEKLKKTFLKSMEIVSFITFPICTLMILLAPELVIGLYGEEWKGAVIPLQILGCFGVFRAMYNVSASFLKASGWVYRIFIAQLIYSTAILVGVWFGATEFGLTGASIAVGISILLMWFMLMELNKQAMDLNRSQIYKSLLPGLLISICLFVIILPLKLLVNAWTPYDILKLIYLGFLSLIVCIICCMILPQKWINYLPFELLKYIEDYIPEHKKKVYTSLLKFISK